MNRATSPALLRTAEGIPVPLKAVRGRAKLSELLAEVEIEQTYRNDEAGPIEAVYSFPLPSGAVLLDVLVLLGDRPLTGRVVARKQAETAYEAAIVDGNAAIMIERPEPDLYVVNVGNLLPGTEVEIKFRYATVLRWQRGQLRFLHPTTIAPRYGPWSVQPHQVPEASLLADNVCQFELSVTGILADAVFTSSSHQIDVGRADGGALIKLRDGEMFMDRDFVLDIRSNAEKRAAILCQPDADGGYACLAMLHPDLPTRADPPPRNVKIVVDCSGSMQGDSIAQARIALQRILELLRPKDRFTIILFGSNHRILFPTMASGDDPSINNALRLIRSAMADMGGTEMGAALEAAYRIPTRTESTPTLILITDGGITETKPVVQAAKASGHRLFPVGVGSAVAEGLLRELAMATGGAVELVAPREDMAERIVRHFRRIDSGGAHLSVDWSVPCKAVYGLDEPVLSGDTALAYARLTEPPRGRIRFSLKLPDGGQIVEDGNVTEAPSDPAGAQSSTISRLVAARELFDLGIAIDAAPVAERAALESKAAALAERNQLLSAWTNWLLIAEQTAGSGELPELRKIAQMVAAGWSGIGTVYLGSAAGVMQDREMPDTMIRQSRPTLAHFHKHIPAGSVSVNLDSPFANFAHDIDNLSAALIRLLKANDKPTIEDLALLPDLPTEAIAALFDLRDNGNDEQELVAAFLKALLGTQFGSRIDRKARRLILKFHRRLTPDAALERRVTDAICAIEAMQTSRVQEVPR